jgi:KRAB domain-containing zinc finger protein
LSQTGEYGWWPCATFPANDPYFHSDPLSVLLTAQQSVKEEMASERLCITIQPRQIGLLSFKCGECGKVFKHFSALKKHMVLHLTKQENEEPLKDSPVENDIEDNEGLVKLECKNEDEVMTEDDASEKFSSDGEVLGDGEPEKPPPKRRKPHKMSQFKCDHCGLKFAHKKSIYRHVLRQHKEQLGAECEMCERVFANAVALRNHQRAAHKTPAIAEGGVDVYPCPYCDEKFELKTCLQKHLKKHDNVLYNCEECGKNFRSNKYLTAHRRLHSEEPKIQCTICNKIFMFQFNLREHMFIHSNTEKLFNCEQCNKSFRTQMLLKLHTLNHPTERQFQCNVCAKRFGYKHLLEVHMRLHTGERPFKCDKCSKGFRSTHSLTLHMDTHLDERKFTCEVCGTAFKAASYLRKHMVLHGEARHKCTYCSKCFKIKSSLLNHIRTHTGEKPFSCETCGMSFPKKSALNDHSWTHKSVKRYNCEVCKRGFSRKEFLRNHSCQARQSVTSNFLPPQPIGGTMMSSFAIKYEAPELLGVMSQQLQLVNTQQQQQQQSFIASP